MCQSVNVAGMNSVSSLAASMAGKPCMMHW